MVTIKDIADKAGVAKSTVSRYLNKGSISPKTKQKIDEVVKETGYQPNTFAQSLKAQNTNMIGVIIPRLDSPSTNEVLSGIDEQARSKGYQLIITNASQESKREIENIKTLAKQKVEGIIFLARDVTEEHRKAINEIDIPVLILGQNMEGFYSMVHEDYIAGYQMGEYASNLGHKKFLYFGVPETDRSVGVERKNGFLEGISKNSGFVTVIETTFSKKDVYNKAISVLNNYDFTYVACATDNQAVAVLKASYELGLNVPDTFSLSGFGGYEMTEYVTPTITTIRYPYNNFGREAIKNLAKLLQKEEVPKTITVSNKLMIKESTKQLNS